MRAKQEFQKFFSKEGINKNASFLLAVSGGLDSMVLMSLCLEMQLNISVAHCNFNLRGEASDLDQDLVRDQCERHQIPFYENSFDTRTYAEQKGLSIQMAARELRYEWFGILMKENDIQYLITAHHKNDNAETILFNLVKGTGISGLRGILPVQTQMLRPLLSLSKEELRDYAEQNNIVWREDASNEETKYHRNYIRKEIIPRLEEINPSFLETLEPSLERLRLADRVWNEFVEESRKKYVREEEGHWLIQKSELMEEGHVLLFELIRDFGFSLDQCKNMLEESGTGRRFRSRTHEIIEDRGRLLMEMRSAVPEAVQIKKEDTEVLWNDLDLHLGCTEGGVDKIKGDPDYGQFDYDLLQFPLEIRSWEAGDYFFPLGMNGKKKISDFMIDRKIPLNLKKRVGLLCSGNEVVWIIGYHMDERFKITENTQKIYQVRIGKNV